MKTILQCVISLVVPNGETAIADALVESTSILLSSVRILRSGVSGRRKAKDPHHAGFIL